MTKTLVQCRINLRGEIGALMEGYSYEELLEIVARQQERIACFVETLTDLGFPAEELLDATS